MEDNVFLFRRSGNLHTSSSEEYVVRYLLLTTHLVREDRTSSCFELERQDNVYDAVVHMRHRGKSWPLTESRLTELQLRDFTGEWGCGICLLDFASKVCFS